jgi:hypothetical protein
MTDVAGRVGDGVTRLLSHGDLVVVAIRTRPERLDVIHEAIVAPRRRLMAALAVIRRYGMPIEERCRARRGHAVVAPETCRRRRLVTRVDVTRRTRNVAVRAGQRKSRRIVIEFRCVWVLRMPWRGNEQECCYDEQQHQTRRSQ